MITVTVVNVDGIILRSDKLDCWEYLLVICTMMANRMEELRPEFEQCFMDMMIYGTGQMRIAA